MFPGRSWTAKSVSTSLSPEISLEEARSSIELLTGLGLLKKAANGYQKTVTTIKTDANVQSLGVLKFHEKMAELALLALRNTPSVERNFSACTLELSSSEYQEVAKLIENTRQKLMEICSKKSKKKFVYNLNFQLFPVSKKISGD